MMSGIKALLANSPLASWSSGVQTQLAERRHQIRRAPLLNFGEISSRSSSSLTFRPAANLLRDCVLQGAFSSLATLKAI